MLVFNKIDLCKAPDLRMIERHHPGAALVSAVRRETTRPLIERIARELAGKWDRSAKGPSVEPVRDERADDGIEAVAPHDSTEMTTVDEMLRAAGKRGSRARAPA